MLEVRRSGIQGRTAGTRVPVRSTSGDQAGIELEVIMTRIKTALVIIFIAFGISTRATAESPPAYATFAGGCFWCMEKPYDHLDGVISTTSGFSGGTTVDPTYREVSRGGTGHIEVVQVEYDPDRVSYEELLYLYWRNIDPLDAGGQFCDRGHTYTTAIFYHDDDQRVAAEKSRQEIRNRLSKRIATDIREFTAFYPADAYHQDYYIRNPVRYNFYRSSCGRDARLNEIWGDEARGGEKYE